MNLKQKAEQSINYEMKKVEIKKRYNGAMSEFALRPIPRILQTLPNYLKHLAVETFHFV